MQDAQPGGGGSGRGRPQPNQWYLPARGPNHPPHDSCSSNHDSAWYWVCQLLVRAGPGLGILPGWVQVGHLILRSFCCNSISVSNSHALLPSFPPPSSLSWGKGELSALCVVLRHPWESPQLTTAPGLLRDERWPWDRGTTVRTKGARPYVQRPGVDSGSTS